MPKVEFKRVETDAEVENIDIKDGQLIYSKSGKTYMDYGDERIATGSGGGSVNVDTEMSDISENAVQNKVIKEYVDDQVSSIPEEVVIDDEEPTDPDVKLWIDTGEIAQAHTEITNEYSTSTGLGYSANYVNTKLLNVLGDRKGTYTFSLEGHVSGGGRFVNVYIPFINLNYNTDTYTITVTAIYQNGAIKSASGTIDSITKYLDGVSVSYNTDETLSNLYNCSINITLVVS